MKKGLLVIISSPSGGGKDTVIAELLKLIPDSSRLVTTTTRPKRPGDAEGVNYFFISEDDFKHRIEGGEFLEYNFYAGHYYGSEKSVLECSLARYDVVFSNIEVNGKKNLDAIGIENLSIFLLPSSIDELRKRLNARGGLTPEIIEERLKIAKNEIKRSSEYDYQLTNEDGKLKEVVEKIRNIIKEHQK